MPKFTPIVALDRILEKLTKQWQEHHHALVQIEVVFTKYGIKPAKAEPKATAAETAEAEPTAAPKAKRGRKGRRGHRLAVSGTNFILGLLGGGKVMTTAQLNAEWTKANRPGKADQSLATMAKAGKLKRQAVKGGRGSQYAVA